jgi:hypothetical protein
MSNELLAHNPEGYNITVFNDGRVGLYKLDILSKELSKKEFEFCLANGYLSPGIETNIAEAFIFKEFFFTESGMSYLNMMYLL